MITGALTTASIHGSWQDQIGVFAADTDTLFDLSDVSEITLKLRDAWTHFDELILTMSHGDITVPSTGVIQWSVDQRHMNVLDPKRYKVIMTIQHVDGLVLVLILGSISIVE